jgi:hypothetical protein
MALDSGIPDRNDGFSGLAGFVYTDKRSAWECILRRSASRLALHGLILLVRRSAERPGRHSHAERGNDEKFFCGFVVNSISVCIMVMPYRYFSTVATRRIIFFSIFRGLKSTAKIICRYAAFRV